MEKSVWTQVKYNDRHGSVPSLRWGHSCCVIDDEVVFFGGYADSNYMNDVWSFNTITMEWTEIETKGEAPSYRSNCSMNYDFTNNRIIVFGGGGANKKRFNTINILDWKTKEWSELAPKENHPAPWQRTYHSAELFYPHLVIFGGEGIGDLDDLWVFNFETMDWTEVPIPKNAIRPCARRFHSSAKIGNQFFVIAGCHSKYRCLSDIYSIDLASLFETGKVGGLSWVDRKMKDSTYLTRWGHTSVALQEKIYLFGGRFSNDLNDILIIDPAKNQITTYKAFGDIPKARRRHSACFLGNSMLIFGGFNGEYFNDLHYITISTSRKKAILSYSYEYQALENIRNIKSIQKQVVKSIDGKQIQVIIGLVVKRFKTIDKMRQFLDSINQSLEDRQLIELITTLYKGYGKIDPSIQYQYGMLIYDSRQSLQSEARLSICEEQRRTSMLRNKIKPVDPVVILDENSLQQFHYRVQEEESYTDITFKIGQFQIKCNRAILCLKSQYFRALLSSRFNECQNIISIPFTEPEIFQTIINYYHTGFVVTSEEYGCQFWVALAQLAEYYSIVDLLNICENHLLTKVTEQNCQQMLLIGLELNLTLLSRSCAQQIIRNMVNHQKQQNIDCFPEIKNQEICIKRQKVLKEIYGLLRFDILQKKIDNEEKEAKNVFKKVENQSSHEEKQNYENRF